MKDLPEPLRRDLLRYFAATSVERARVIVGARKLCSPTMMDLEPTDDLRALFEIELASATGLRCRAT